MILLLDIGNTNVNVGWANPNRVLRQAQFPTSSIGTATFKRQLKSFAGPQTLTGCCFCSVVPKTTRPLRTTLRSLGSAPCHELNHATVQRIGINYPRPETIGPDRLAAAVAVRVKYGHPAVVVDFGTAVTFDVVDRRGRYTGGIIAPGLAAMTDYLHEKTALLPRIQIRDTRAVIGKSTREAMLIGAVHGYRGLIRELVRRLRTSLRCPNLPVVATGGSARLVARQLPEITAVDPLLTLDGLRLEFVATQIP